MPYLHLGYKKLHYTDLQPQHRAPRETFIWTHGIGSSQNYYLAVALRLQSHGFRCIIYDTTGAGRSPYTQIEQSVESLSLDIIGVLDALKIPKAIVVGHSLGSVTAAHVAGERPDRIVAAILIGPVYPNASLVPILETRIETVQKEGMDAMANTIPYDAPAKSGSPLIRAFIRELLLGQTSAGYISQCRVLLNAKAPDYSKVKVPVLVMAGEEDKTAPLDGCKKVFDELGTEEKKMEVLKAVGHWQCVEAPEEVAKCILAFCYDIQ